MRVRLTYLGQDGSTYSELCGDLFQDGSPGGSTMNLRQRTLISAACVFFTAAAGFAQDGAIGKVNLMTQSGVDAVKGQWRYADIVTGTGKARNELEPKAHGKFDDSKWEVLKPEALSKGRGPGGYSWCWYRIQVTIPNDVDGKSFAGGPVWFETTVDDYGEIWVDGAIDNGRGRGAIAGFNSKNRVRLQKTEVVEEGGKKKNVKRDAKPGEIFQIALLAINSPLGNPPGNKIFLRGLPKHFTGLEFFDAKAKGSGADVPKVEAAPKGTIVGQLDLLKKEDVEAIKGTWRRHAVTFHAGDARNEIEPKAHGKFDDSKWEAIEDPALLKKPFGPGKLSMSWCRINVTIPEKVGGKDVKGTAVWFRTKVDDYAEVYVDGKIDLVFGSSGRGAISGFNQFNEVKLTDNAVPGQSYTIAVLAINGPFGNPPGNNIFFHGGSTVLRFFQEGK